MIFQGSKDIQDLIKQSYFLIVILGICAFICYEIYLASTNDKMFKQNSMYYFVIILIPLISVLLYILYGYTFDHRQMTFFYVTLLLSLSILLIVYFLLYTNLSYVIFNQYMLYTVSIGIALIGLAIIYNVFSERLKKQEGLTGFLVNFIFYIPCLISDFIQAVIKESNETPRTTFILFVVEISLIIFYLYLFPMIQSTIQQNSIVLLNNPIMLSGSTRVDADLKIQKFDEVIMPHKTSILNYGNVDPDKTIRQRFALSMWIYINPLSASKLGYTKETNIFNYGYLGTGGTGDSNVHPQIVHKPNTNGKNIRIYLTSINGKPYDTTIPYQKWNNIVFNYNGDSIDIFINGSLEYTHLFTNDQPKFLDTDIMVVGQDNGFINNDSVYGSICSIIYNKEPLTNTDIIYNYNTMMYKNPPVR